MYVTIFLRDGTVCEFYESDIREVKMESDKAQKAEEVVVEEPLPVEEPAPVEEAILESVDNATVRPVTEERETAPIAEVAFTEMPAETPAKAVLDHVRIDPTPVETAPAPISEEKPVEDTTYIKGRDLRADFRDRIRQLKEGATTHSMPQKPVEEPLSVTSTADESKVNISLLSIGEKQALLAKLMKEVPAPVDNSFKEY